MDLVAILTNVADTVVNYFDVLLNATLSLISLLVTFINADMFTLLFNVLNDVISHADVIFAVLEMFFIGMAVKKKDPLQKLKTFIDYNYKLFKTTLTIIYKALTLIVRLLHIIAEAIPL